MLQHPRYCCCATPAAGGVACRINVVVQCCYANRGRLRYEAIKLASKLFYKNDNTQVGASKALSLKNQQAQQLNSFNLMVARKEYIQYIWFGIQFLYMQGELIQKVIETTEGEIQTLLKPYYRGDEKKQMKDLVGSEEDIERLEMIYSRITKRPERLHNRHLDYTSLEEQQETQREVRSYLLQLSDDVENRLHRIKKQWSSLQLQNNQRNILRAMKSREDIFKHNHVR